MERYYKACAFLLCVPFVNGIGEMLKPGVYRVQSAEDLTVLTATDSFQIVPGRDHKLSAVVVSKYDNLPEQEWDVHPSPLGIPEQYTLTSRRFTRNRVSYSAPDKYYEVPSEWHLIYLGGDRWQLKNMDSKRCLINWGRWRDVDEWRCDKYARNQQWIFQKI